MTKLQKYKHNKGFTLIELLTVIGIISILVAVGVPSYLSLKNNVSFQNSVEEIINTLRMAQNKAITAQDGSDWGVYFENDKYTLFRGEAYDSDALDNIEYNLPEGQILGASTEVIFKRLDGTAEEEATICLNPPGCTKNIEVKQSGQISSSHE